MGGYGIVELTLGKFPGHIDIVVEGIGSEGRRFGGDRVLVMGGSRSTTCGEAGLGDAPPKYATDYQEKAKGRRSK